MYYILNFNFNFSSVNYLKRKNGQGNHATETDEKNIQLNIKSVPHICAFSIKSEKLSSVPFN
jgi:hypothetical protein